MWLYIASFFLTILFWIWIIRKYDRFEREPLKNILLVFIAGGLISSIPAGILNFIVTHLMDYQDNESYNLWSSPARTLFFYGFVGLNEEFWKAAATILLIRRMKSFNEPADALVYAMTVAFGFSVLENIDYSLELGLPWFFARQFNAVQLHLGLAAIWGIGIARAKFIRQGRFFPGVIPYFLMAAFLHFVYNLSTMIHENALVSLLIPTVIAWVLIIWAVRRIRKYSEEGPFSRYKRCRHCGTLNLAIATRCKKCEEPLANENQSLI